MTWSEKVMLHSNRSVWSAWTYLWCFHRSSWSLSKVIAEKLLVTFLDLKWPWRHDESSLVAIFRFEVSSLPINDVVCLSVSNGFRPEEVPFNFLLLTCNDEVVKLTWPWVTHIKISRYTFYRCCYGCQSLNVSRWSVIRCSYDEHFLLGEVTWRDLVTWPWATWVWHFPNMCGKDVWTGVPKTAAHF